MRLVLCRHAEAGNGAQAQELARALARIPLAAVYTSPLARAMETARVVAAAHGLQSAVVDDLREIDRGDVEPLQFEDYPRELQAALLDAPATVSFPGGESYEELRARVVAAVASIVSRHEGKNVAAISHSGPIRAALATWLQVAPDAGFRLDQRFAAVNVIDWSDGIPFVRLVNAATIPAALRAAL
jgi:broad specificity phosphatase PhoE